MSSHKGVNENPNVISNLVYPQNNQMDTTTAHWNPQDFRFYATNYDRTLFSVFSIAQAMFPNGYGPLSDISLNGQVNAMPQGMQPIPIHTQTSTNEIWMSGYGKCPTIDLNNEENQQSSEYLKMISDFKPYLKIISNLTGIPFENGLITMNSQKSFLSNIFSNTESKDETRVPFYKYLANPEDAPAQQESTLSSYPQFTTPIDFSNFYLVLDLLNVQYSHNQLNLKGILDIWEKILQIGDASTYSTFSRKVQGTLGGGPLVQKMIVEMEKMISSLSGLKADKQADNYGADPDESKTVPYKYVHYSAHDVTILSLMAALKLSDDYPQLRAIPPYGSQILFELHQSDNVPAGQKPTLDDFYIRIRYNRGFSDDSFTEYSLISLAGTGCKPGKDSNFNCSYSNFKSVCQADAIPKDWCSECKNTKADICVRALYEKERSLTTIMLVILPIMGGLLLILLVLIAIIRLRSSKLSRMVRGTADTTTINSESATLYQTLH